MPVDRLRPRYSLRSMACLLRIAPSSYHYHHARIGVDKYAGLRARVARAFADSKGRYGYRRVKAALGTGVSEKVIRRIMAEGGLSAHVPKRRRYSSYEGETTPAPGNLVNRDFTAERPNEKWLTDITEIKARDGKVYLSPMIDCHCVCSIESGPCERVDVFHVSGRFWSTSACGEKRTPARPAWTSFPS